MMSIFGMPYLLPLAVILPVCVALLLVSSHRSRIRRFANMGGGDVVQRLLPHRTFHSPRSRIVLLSGAAMFAGIAVADPRWGTEESRISGSGIDIVLALDASLSMMATDERPSRLERMKQEVRRLRATSRGDRIGVIAFAGRSYILTPLTTDEGALDLFIENLDPSIVGQAGSSVSRAIRQGTDLLQATQSASDRALVVMSDWESFEEESEVLEAARIAGEAGITVVTVGFGTPEGSRIPVESGGRTIFKTDEAGRIVVTQYNPYLLRAAAEAANGTFIDAAETDKASRVRRALADLQAQQRALNVGRDRKPRFQLFLVPAFLLLLLDTLRTERRGRPRTLLNATPALRRAAAGASVAAMLFAPVQMDQSVHDRAAMLVKEKRYVEAISEYRRRIAGGDETEKTLYNLGTSLLQADSLVSAMEVLDRLVRAEDADLRYRALFNKGLAQLRLGLNAQGDGRSAALDEAIESYRNVLLMRPDDIDAKWNYELALNEKDQGGGGGGGQQEQESQSSEQNSQSERDRSDAPSGLGRDQAEQILNNAARDERDVQARSQDRNRPSRPPGGKDW